MTHPRRRWLLLLVPLLLVPAVALRAEPVPIPSQGLPTPEAALPIDGAPLDPRIVGPLLARMLNQAEVPAPARPLLDTLRRGMERGGLSADEVTGLQRGLLGLIQSLPAAMGGRP
jgi:hypothetical protein